MVKIALIGAMVAPLTMAPMPMRTATISNGIRFSLFDLNPHFIPEELPLFLKKRKVYILLTNNR